MNVLEDRQQLGVALRFGPDRHNLAPTGNAYVATDGTLWHEFVTMDVDDVTYWLTTRPDPKARFNRDPAKRYSKVKDPAERDHYFS